MTRPTAAGGFKGVGAKLIDLNIRRNGPIMASDLEAILNAFASDLQTCFIEMGEAAGAEIRKLREEVRALRHELEAERRLRLGQRGRR